MYEKIKKLVPTKFVKKNEDFFRNILAIAYRGNTYHCNICGFKMSNFIKLKNNSQICPKCGSLGRTRRLWRLLEQHIQDKKTLHFSPSKSIKTKLESVCNDYTSTDYVGEFNANKRLNIESIDEPDNKYDLIICYHILEHIENDIKGMKELFRILKPEGKCYIQTPFKTGDIYEDDSIKTDEERLLHFGQKDHLRIYSSEGLISRLKQAGFKTKLLTFDEDENNKNGYPAHEKIIIASKPSLKVN